MFSRIGATELLLILAMVLLIFGPKNLPKLGKAIGETINGFKAGHKDAEAGEEKETASSEDHTAV